MDNSANRVIMPPVAKKVKCEMEMFGDVRNDDYYWLRDDSRSDHEILDHLRQENAYTDFIMSGTKDIEDEIYAEIRGRIKEDDVSVPLRRGSYYYYEKTLEGKEYVQHCRRLASNEEVNMGPPSVYDVMPQGDDAPPEHVILDENVKAQEHAYYSIGAFKVSPSNKLVAYAEDSKGDEMYTIYVIDIETKSIVGQPLVGSTSYIEWVGDEVLLYITDNEINRSDKVWMHKLGMDQSTDFCLYHEEDEKFSLSLKASASKKYVFVESGSKTTRFIFYFDISKPENGLMVLTPRSEGIDTTVSHRGNHFFMKRRTREYFNSELLVCPLDNISATTVLLPHRESVKLKHVEAFSDHLAVYERENGLVRIITYRLPPVGERLKFLQAGKAVSFIDPIYSVEPSESQYSSSILRFSYSSMRTPPSVYDYDMNTGISVLKKVDTVVGFEAKDYATERIWATAPDGTQIPISIVYRKDLVNLDGSDPLVLYAYGSYESCRDPTFSISNLSLLDRGFIHGTAHVRGGGEMGRQWYENGKLLKKINTFTDFIACAEYLIEKKYGSKEKLCIYGGSAGGLLIGAVLNMRPDLFKVAVALVPFVDVLTTMLDSTIPLTTAEWEEWGDPRQKEFYDYIKSYSPVDNVKAQAYPHILVTTGLHDPRVMYSEPAKFVAKLREMKTNDNLLLFKCDFGAGHFSKSGRFEKLREYAFMSAFMLKALNMVPTAIQS